MEANQLDFSKDFYNQYPIVEYTDKIQSLSYKFD